MGFSLQVHITRASPRRGRQNSGLTKNLSDKRHNPSGERRHMGVVDRFVHVSLGFRSWMKSDLPWVHIVLVLAETTVLLALRDSLQAMVARGSEFVLRPTQKTSSTKTMRTACIRIYKTKKTNKTRNLSHTVPRKRPS